MKMLKRVGIFPVDQESITLFENIHECRYGEIMHIASIKAWGLCGKKIQRCDGSEIIIEEGIGNIIKECEVLILLESWHDASPEYIKSVVKTAKQKSITIVSINNIRNSLEIDQHYENVVVAKKLKIQKKCDDLRVRKINIPVICVLGLTQNSGKLKMELELQKCLKQKGYKVAVIVNDIGEVNIDASLIEKGGQVTQKDDNLVPLQNGCICCTLKVDLINQIIDLIGTGKFDYILIEASGICEPIPIAQSITMLDGSYDKKAQIARLDNIVSVVDVARMADEFGCGENLVKDDIDDEDIENLIIQQIEFCNTIILNKVDTVTPEQLGKVKAIIRKLQPEAVMFETNYGQIDVDEILNTNRFDFEKSSMSAGWIHELEEADLDEDDDHDEHHHEHNEDHDHDHDHDHEHHDHDDHDEHEHHGHHHHHHHHGEGETEEYGIGSFVYYRRRPFAKEKFEDWLDEMPKGIIRSKGIIWAAENNNDAYMFEQAGKQINIANAGQWVATAPRRVRAKMMKEDPTLVEDWDEKVGDRMIKVVFIGHDMDKEAIIKSLDDCLAY